MSAATDLEDVAERIDAAIDRVRRPVTLTAARALCNETRVMDLSRRLADTPVILANALEAKRLSDERLRKANEALSAARVEAEWELDARFETEANKVYLILVPGNAEESAVRKQMTADERRDWKAREADKVPAVARARKDVLEAEAAVAAARDSITVAERTAQALRHELDAAVAVLTTLRMGLVAQEESKA